MAKKQPKTQSEVKDIKNTKDIGVIDPAVQKAAAALLKKAPFKTEVFNKKGESLTEDRLLNLADTDYVRSILDVLWPKSQFTPKKHQATTDELVNAGMKILYKDSMDPQSIAGLMQAYVYRAARASYRIFINGTTEAEAFDSMDLHEKGHILYLHTDNVKIYKDLFSKELDKIWDEKVSKWFTDDAKKGYKKSKIVDFIFDQFSNIAQDMEINSKLFEKEWIDAKLTMARSNLIMRIVDIESHFDDLSKALKDQKERKIDSPQYLRLLDKFLFIVSQLEKRAKGEIDDILFCYPSYYDWPEKLDWITYLMLLVKNQFDDVMNQIQQMMNAMQQASGQGNSQGQSSGQGPGGGKQISKDVLDDYFDDKNAQDKAQSGSPTSGDEEQPEDGDEEASASGGANERSEGGSGKGAGSGAWIGEIQTCKTFDSFTKFINKICLGKKLMKFTTDLMYYANRGKNSGLGGVILPRRYHTEKWMPTAATFVIDISGSVATDYVERIINAVVSANSGIDLKKSHIVFCDTNVVGDEILSKRTKKVWAGGGTRIASGIKYVFDKGYVKTNKDKLFVVSDLEDDLTEWVRVAHGHAGQKFVIGYNVNGDRCFDAKKMMKRWIPDNERGYEFVKTFTTLFIEEVID
jgi:hypothetical protein